MPRQQGDAPATHGDGLEQAIAISQATVANRQLLAGRAVDPAQHQPWYRRNSSEPLVPPKPKEFDRAISIGMALAWCATKSRSQPSSGSSRLMAVSYTHLVALALVAHAHTDVHEKLEEAFLILEHVAPERRVVQRYGTMYQRPGSAVMEVQMCIRDSFEPVRMATHLYSVPC